MYGLAMSIGEKVWGFVGSWDYFQKDTIGKQLQRSADSIAANISEGYGRYPYKDSKNFAYYSRGSLYETKTWLLKAHNRKFISENDYHQILVDLETLAKMLNSYIKTIGQASEPNIEYQTPTTNNQ